MDRKGRRKKPRVTAGAKENSLDKVSKEIYQCDTQMFSGGQEAVTSASGGTEWAGNILRCHPLGATQQPHPESQSSSSTDCFS